MSRRRRLIDEGVAAALLNPATGDLVTRPDHHGLECFYAAALERVSLTHQARLGTAAPARSTRHRTHRHPAPGTLHKSL